MASKSFSEAAIERAKPATKAQERYEWWDKILPGLGLRVSWKGTKTFLLMYRVDGKQRRMTLGRYADDFRLGEARTAARAALEKVKEGIDPAAPIVAEAPAIGADGKKRLSGKSALTEILDAWIKGPVKQRRGDWKAVERALKLDLGARFGDRPVNSITREDIFEVIDAVVERGSPVHANRLLWMMKPLFRWCVERKYITEDPAGPITRPTEESSRNRVLDMVELARVWNAAGKLDYPFGPIVRLLILTAQRRDEVAGMRWSELDIKGATWTLPPERTKNGKEHQVALAPAALAIIEKVPQQGSAFLFSTTGKTVVSGWSRAKDRIDRVLMAPGDEIGPPEPLRHWTLHDLRRSAATRMAELRIAPHVVEKILNHQGGGAIGGTVGEIYNRFEYSEERRAALLLWAETVAKVVG